MSNLLSHNYKVPSVLLESQVTQERFRHPQAHFLNTRTVEILRYWLPAVYNEVQTAMPPVDQWKTFRFVSNMSQADPLAEVLHPVDMPLQVNRDANGVLVEDAGTKVMQETSRRDLSVCKVGHLAQHTYCRILYDHAKKCALPETRIIYGTKVKSVSPPFIDSDDRLRVETACGQEISSDLVIAADGSHSPTRNAFGINFRGKEGIQHLMNVHVRLSKDQATRLHTLENKRIHAMLYSVFSPQVVAMVVCHSIGEYVIQIPFFPPYQTVEEDFSPDKLHIIIQAIFGPSVEQWEVVSARPWTMSALIADRYYDERGVALVGDSAHVFPPAGGFGMNTGSQDVHNLAWKVAWAFHNDQLKRRSVRKAILKSYHNERRSVAQQNAALSVRNYGRLLQVTKSCYLDEQHPTLLKSILDRAPLPLAMRQATFRSLLRAALYPLSWMEQADSMYAKHIRENLRRILRTGAGLPLLFPKYELYFDYVTHTSGTNNASKQDDTWAPPPTIKPGRLLPHAEVVVVSANEVYPNIQFCSTEPHLTMSTSNLAPQLARGCQPAFVLLCVGGIHDSTIVSVIAEDVSKQVGLPVEVVHLVQTSSGLDPADTSINDLVLRERQGESFSFFSPDRDLPYLVLIRPDGHIAFIHDGPFNQQGRIVSRICESLAFIS